MPDRAPALEQNRQRLAKTALFRFFLAAGSAQDVAHAVVALMARVLERLLALVGLGEVHRERPWPRPCVRIVEGDRPLDGVRPEQREALDHLQLIARAAIRRLVREVRGFDNESVAFPAPRAVAHVLTDAAWRVVRSVEWTRACVV